PRADPRSVTAQHGSGGRRSAYEAPHGSAARTRVQRRRIEAETVPPLPCTAVSGHAPSSATTARGLCLLGRRRGRLDHAHRRGSRGLVAEPERGREPAPDHLRHQEGDVDAGVREAAREGGAEARAVVALDQQTRDVAALRQPGLRGRRRRPLPAHGVELDRRALRGVRQTIAHDQAQVRARLGERLEGSRERARVVVDVRAPEGDTLDRDRHETSFGWWCAPLLAHLHGSLKDGAGTGNARLYGSMDGRPRPDRRASALLYSTQGVARERAGRRGVRQCIRGTYPHRSGTDLTRVRHSEPAPRPCGLAVFVAPPLLCGRWPPDATARAAERRCSTSWSRPP